MTSFSTEVPSSRSAQKGRACAFPQEHEPYAPVRVVTPAELAFEDRGWTRGHAHIGFDDHPVGAPGRLDFSPLKLVALQTIDPGKGYALHPHRDIETVTYVLDGTMTHEDSLGNSLGAERSELAVLSAGRGIQHSEFALGTSVRAVLFWLKPSVLGTEPRFLKRSFPPSGRRNELVAIASGRADAPPSALPLRRDATLFAAHLASGGIVRHRLAASRRAYAITTDAFVTVNCRDVEAGSRVLAEGPGLIEIHAHGETELLLFDID